MEDTLFQEFDNLIEELESEKGDEACEAIRGARTDEEIRKDMIISMAFSTSLFERSLRLHMYNRYLRETGAKSLWLLDHIHESEVQFRQTMRHEGLEDRLGPSLENTPFATLRPVI